jgi:hypothetical protein
MRGESDRLPGCLQSPLERKHLSLPADLRRAEMWCEAVPISYDVIAIRHHTSQDSLQAD